MRACVLGCGSIGTRHIRNLITLGITDLTAYDPVLERRSAVIQEFDITCFETLERVWEAKPHAVVIASPPHLHMDLALAAAARGAHLFIEKPLSDRWEGLDQLMAAVAEQTLVTMVGCNMRFHPGPAKVKSLVDQGRTGKILFARVHTGSYLPSWRPHQDYRKSYSADSRLGGGCILDCIHEIDLVRWYMGEVEQVACMARHISSLDLDVEDVAALMFSHNCGAISEVHLDYVQRTYERGCQIVGEKGSITWDYSNGAVRYFESDTGTWDEFKQDPRWQVNDMYVEELRHFLGCVETRQRTTLPVEDAVAVMGIALAAKASAQSGRFIAPASVC